MQAIRKSHGNEVDRASPFDDIWAGFLPQFLEMLKKEICLYISKSTAILLLFQFLFYTAFEVLYFKFSFNIFLVFINCIPKLVWDFPRLCGIDTLIKFFVYFTYLRFVMCGVNIAEHTL